MVKWVRLVQSLIFGIGYLHMGLALGALGPTIQPLASQLHVSLSQMGWMFAARGIGALFGSLLLGKMYDLGAPCVTFAACLHMMAISLYMTSLLPSFAWVVAAHFLTGVGVGCSDTGGNVLLVWLWEGDSMLTAAMQFLHACFGAGSVMVGVVAANFSVTSTYLLMALSVGASTALTLSIAHIPIVPKSQQDDADAAAAAAAADATKEQLATRDGDETLDKQAPETTDATAPTSGPTQGGGRETEVVVFISIMLLLLVGIEVAFGGMIGVYSTRMLGMSESAAAYVTAVFWLSFTGMRIVSIVVVMFVSEPTLITLNSLGSVLSALVLVVFPFEAWAMWTCCIGFGISVASMFPTAMALAPLLGYTLNAASMRFLVFGAAIGELTVPWLAAILVDNVGPVWLPILVGLVMIIIYGTFVVLWLRNRSSALKTAVVAQSVEANELQIEMQDVRIDVQADDDSLDLAAK